MHVIDQWVIVAGIAFKNETRVVANSYISKSSHVVGRERGRLFLGKQMAKNRGRVERLSQSYDRTAKQCHQTDMPRTRSRVKHQSQRVKEAAQVA